MKNVYQPKLEIEKKLTEEGFERICGVDEAGRGPLCGAGSRCCGENAVEKSVENRGMD